MGNFLTKKKEFESSSETLSVDDHPYSINSKRASVDEVVRFISKCQSEARRAI